MPHKDDSRFSILTVTMIIIIYIGNKSNSEKKYLTIMMPLLTVFHLYCVGQATIVTKSFIIMGYANP